MYITPQQLETASTPNLYLCFDPALMEDVATKVQQYSQQRQFHLAILDGSKIVDASSVLRALAQAYVFPGVAEGYTSVGWDGAGDWLGDLGWLRNAGTTRGFVLLYRQPQVLFAADPVSFAMLLDLLGTESQHHIAAGLPFSIIIGPLNHQAAAFINTLRIAPQVSHMSFNESS